MSTRSFSATRTLRALVSRQSNDLAIAEVRSFTRSYTTGTLPLMAETPAQRDFSLTVEALPDFGPWAIAYTADQGVKELPVSESYFFVKVPGIKRIVRRGIAYSV